MDAEGEFNDAERVNSRILRAGTSALLACAPPGSEFMDAEGEFKEAQRVNSRP
jgi:hypothetical protein